MAYATPRTWVAGDVLTAAQMNQDVRDNVSFLGNPPSCRVYHNTTQSIANNADTVTAFNSERWDTASMHDNVTNNSRLTAPIAGLYVITFSGQFLNAADYLNNYVLFRMNGTTIIGAGTTSGTVTAGGAAGLVAATTIYKLAATDYVEVMTHQQNGAAAARNLINGANYTPEFTMSYVGIG